jgi:hypothetical protein
LFRCEKDYHEFHWPELGTVRIEKSGVVTVHERPQVAEGLVAHVLLGAVMADWLLMKGQIALHANCVTFGHRGLALVGQSGAGKSSLGAALTQAGAQPHGDDLVSIDPVDAFVPFGTSRAKLNPDVLAALGMDTQSLPRVYSTVEKRTMPLTASGDPPRPVKLDAIYVLLEGSEQDPSFVKLDGFGAAMAILSNIFHIEFHKETIGAQSLLDRSARVASKTPVFLLRRQKDLGKLLPLAECVKDHFLSLSSVGSP